MYVIISQSPEGVTEAFLSVEVLDTLNLPEPSRDVLFFAASVALTM